MAVEESVSQQDSEQSLSHSSLQNMPSRKQRSHRRPAPFLTTKWSCCRFVDLFTKTAFNQYTLEHVLRKQRTLQRFDACLSKCDPQMFYSPVASKNMRFGSKCQKGFCSFHCVLKGKVEQKDGSYCGPGAFLCCTGFFLSSSSSSFFTPDVFHLWRHT